MNIIKLLMIDYINIDNYFVDENRFLNVDGSLMEIKWSNMIDT